MPEKHIDVVLDDDVLVKGNKQHLFGQSRLLDPARQRQRWNSLLRCLEQDSPAVPFYSGAHCALAQNRCPSRPVSEEIEKKRTLFRIEDARLKPDDDIFIFVFELRLEGPSRWDRARRAVLCKLVWVESVSGERITTESSGPWEYAADAPPALEFDIYFCPRKLVPISSRLKWISSGSGVVSTTSDGKIHQQHLGKMLVFACSLVLDSFGVPEATLQDAAKVAYLALSEAATVFVVVNALHCECTRCRAMVKALHRVRGAQERRQRFLSVEMSSCSIRPANAGRGERDRLFLALVQESLERYIGAAPSKKESESPRQRTKQVRLFLAEEALLSGALPWYARNFGYVTAEKCDLGSWIRDSRRLRGSRFPEEFLKTVCTAEFSADPDSRRKEADEAVVQFLERRNLLHVVEEESRPPQPHQQLNTNRPLISKPYKQEVRGRCVPEIHSPRSRITSEHNDRTCCSPA